MMTPGLINLLSGIGWHPPSKVAVIGTLALICWLPILLIVWWLWL
jgi:hypothetical protein